EPALAEDRLLAALERLREGLELAAQKGRKLALRDRAIRARIVGREVVEPRARAVVVTAAERRIERRLGRREPALHLDHFLLADVELLREQRAGRLEPELLELLALLAQVEEQLALRLRGSDLDEPPVVED